MPVQKTASLNFCTPELLHAKNRFAQFLHSFFSSGFSSHLLSLVHEPVEAKPR